jgi:tocopherol O-methyltransferase
MLQDVVRYYEEALIDYRLVWFTGTNHALHFGHYDEEHRSHASALRNANAVLARMAKVQPGEHVLDAGCGLGGSCFWLSRQRGARVTGITPCVSHVQRARDIARQHGLEAQATFEVADFTSTSFSAGSFDVAWALESLCHAPRKASFYEEMFRVLRPGGRLIVAEFIRKRRSLTTQQEKLLHGWMSGWSIPDLDTKQEHVAAATAAGFEQVSLTDASRGIRRSLQRLHYWSWLAVPVDWLLYTIGVRTPAQHGNVRASFLQYRAFLSNLWFYGIVSAVKPR